MEVKKQNKFALFAIIGLFAIVVLLLTDILIGMSNIGFKDIIDSIFNYNNYKTSTSITLHIGWSIYGYFRINYAKLD